MPHSKSAIAAALVIMFVFSAWASGQDARPARTETRLNAQLHRSFRIIVDSNPSTGYSWTAVFDKSSLKLESSRYERPAQQIPGRGGKHVFVFLPLKSGETVIALEYKRPWEPKPVKIKTYSVSVAPTRRGN